MKTDFSFSADGLSDIGLRRTNNEDSFLVHCKKGCFLVADGMGGAAAGEIASRIFTETADQIVPPFAHRTEEKAVELIKKIFFNANAKIRAHIQNTPSHKGMGCTADLLLFHHYQGFTLGHIGDSRTYLQRDGHLSLLTRDHSLIQDYLDQGLISKAEARNHRLRNVINKAVGVNEQLELDIIRGPLFKGDFFLLCSDGLTDMVCDENIEKILLKKESLSNSARLLVEQAKAGGGKDNITVVLVGVE